jgi:hypothetical protein
MPSLPSLCLLLSACTWIPVAAPPDALFKRQLNWAWGEDGAFCVMAFGERVRSNDLPAFIAAQERRCAQGDAMGCQDEADARLGGCAGTARDRDRGMALLKRACELGSPEACRGYASSLPSKSWWFFANSERQWAEARELELKQKLK